MKKADITRQKQMIAKAIMEADMGPWHSGAKVKLNERMATQICIELLSYGFITFGEGDNTYLIKATENTNIGKYMEKYVI